MKETHRTRQQRSVVIRHVFLKLLLCVLSTLYVCVATNSTGDNSVLNAAMRLGSDVSKLFTNSTGVDAFEESVASQSSYKVIGIDARKLTADLAHQMAEIIEKRSHALWQTKKALEETAGDSASWMTGDDVSERNISVASTSFSHFPVNLSLSSVKLPLDVDNTDSSVASAILWSRSLDRVVIDNLVADPSASWQYFGSKEGFIRVYPGLKELRETAHTFDARFERWYIEGSVLPADVVILIDTSGSMHGLPLKIANQTTIGIIDLLTERDRLAIITFSSKVKVLGCSEPTLVRATRETKSMFVQALSSLRSQSVSSYEPAFELATELLLNVNATYPSRQKIIVLFTDGSSVRDIDYFSNWNVDKRIRVFSTVVSHTALSTGSSPRLACENNGFYTEIRNLEGARDALRSFIKLLGRTTAFHNISAPISPPSRSAIDGQHVVKLSLPVINGTDGIYNTSLPAPTLLGVVGIDIPLSDLQGVVPSHIVGPLAYAFVIDNYGRSLVHPNLKNELFDSLAADVSQLEGDSFADIRAEMLRGETGSKTRTRSFVSEIEGSLYVRQLETTYYYMPLEPNSTISVCLVLPKHQNTTTKATENTQHAANPSASLASITPWLQCVNARDFNTSDIDGFTKTVDTNGTACKEWKDRVLVDLNVTAQLADTWTDEPDVCVKFVSTLAGVTMTKPHKFNCNLSGYDPTNDQVIKSRVTRSVLNGNSNLIVKDTARNTTQITKAVYYNTTPIAVVGMDIRAHILRDIFQHNVENLLNATNRIYLIDQSGYILDYLRANSTTLDTRRGHFIGEYENSLLNKTIQKGLFTAVTVSSYTTRCMFQQAVSSGAASFFLTPWSLFLKYILVLLYNLTMFLLRADLVGLISGTAFTAEATAVSSTPVLRSCLQHQTVYSAFNLSYDRESYCCMMDVESTQCSATYTIASIPNTNLLLVVINGDASHPYCDTLLQSQLMWTRLASPCTLNLSEVTEQTQPVNITNQLGRYLCTSRGYSDRLPTFKITISTLLAIVLLKMTCN